MAAVAQPATLAAAPAEVVDAPADVVAIGLPPIDLASSGLVAQADVAEIIGEQLYAGPSILDLTVGRADTSESCVTVFSASDLLAAANVNHNPAGSVSVTDAGNLFMTDGYIGLRIGLSDGLQPLSIYTVKADVIVPSDLPNDGSMHMRLHDNIGDGHAFSSTTLYGYNLTEQTVSLTFVTDSAETGEVEISFWKDPNFNVIIKDLRIEGVCGTTDSGGEDPVVEEPAEPTPTPTPTEPAPPVEPVSGDICASFSDVALFAGANPNHNPAGLVSFIDNGVQFGGGYISLEVSQDNVLADGNDYLLVADLASVPDVNNEGSMHIRIYDGNGVQITSDTLYGWDFSDGQFELPFTAQSTTAEVRFWKDPGFNVVVGNMRVEGICEIVPPSLSVSVASDAFSAEIDTPITFTATPADAAGSVSYSWQFGDNADFVTGDATISHSFAATGGYNVRARADDGSTVVTSDPITVIISEAYIPPDDGGNNPEAEPAPLACVNFSDGALFAGTNVNHNPAGTVEQLTTGVQLGGGYLDSSVSSANALTVGTPYKLMATLDSVAGLGTGGSMHIRIFDGNGAQISGTTLYGYDFVAGPIEVPFVASTPSVEVRFWKDPDFNAIVKHMRVDGECDAVPATLSVSVASDLTSAEVDTPITFTATTQDAAGDVSYRWRFDAGDGFGPTSSSPTTSELFRSAGTYAVSVLADDGSTAVESDAVIITISEASDNGSGDGSDNGGEEPIVEEPPTFELDPNACVTFTTGQLLLGSNTAHNPAGAVALSGDGVRLSAGYLNLDLSSDSVLFAGDTHLLKADLSGSFPANYSGALHVRVRENGNEIASTSLYETDAGLELAFTPSGDAVELAFWKDNAVDVVVTNLRITHDDCVGIDGGTVAPKAVISAETTSSKIDTPISFDGSGSSDVDGVIMAYDWDFGDGNSSSEQSPTYSYAVAGNYTVSLTVTDSDSLTTTATLDMTIAADGGIEIEVAQTAGVSGYPIGIFGSGFGVLTGTVEILGVSANISEWTDSFIRATVPPVDDGTAPDGLYITNADGDLFGSAPFTVYTIAPEWLIAPSTTYTNVSHGKPISLTGVTLGNSLCNSQITGEQVDATDFLTNYACRYDVGAKFAADSDLGTESTMTIDFEQTLAAGDYLFQFFSRADWSEAVDGQCPGTGYPGDYVLQVSAEATTWSDPLITITDNLRGNRSHMLAIPDGSRYLRLTVTDSVADCLDSIDGKDFEMKELRLYQASGNGDTHANAIAIYGDSIAAGAFNGSVGLNELNALLEGQFPANMPTTAAGFSGRKASDLATNFEDPNELADVYALDANASSARYWGIALGSNDINLSGEADEAFTNPESQFNQFDESIEIDAVQWLIERGHVPILARIPDTTDEGYGFLAAKKKILNDIDQIAAAYRLIPGPDLYTDVRLNIERDGGSWMAGDGTHLADDGPTQWLSQWADAFAQLCGGPNALDFCAEP